MNRWLDRCADWSYVALRITTGLMFACHGSQKLIDFPAGAGHATGPLMIWAGAIELVAGWLVALGLGTRLAAFLASGEMAVAYFMAHAPQGFFPIQNKGELAVVYCFVFLYLASRGSGSLSLDERLRPADRT